MSVPSPEATSEPATPAPPPSLGQRVLKAGSWSLFGNIASQALRFGGNLIMTRLLFPEAFGLMTIAQSILLAVNLLSDVGLSQSIVRSPRGREPGFLNTIWSLQIIKAALTLCMLCLLAPFVAKGYGHQELTGLLPAIGLGALISGFTSTKVALASRQLQMARLTQMELGSQLTGLLVMIGAAWLHPSVWALVAGNIASNLTLVLAGHLLLKGPGNKPGWDLSVVREVWQFGSWVLMSSAVTYLAGEGRNLLNAALVDARTVGLLVLSTTLNLVIWNAIQQVGGRVLFPAYAEVWRERPHELPRVVSRSRMLQLLAGCSMATIFALLGDRIIGLLYDHRYADAGAFIQIQAVGTCVSFVGASYAGVLFSIGRSGLNTLLLLAQVILMAALLVGGHALWGPLGMVLGIACTGLAMYPVNTLVFRRFGLFNPKLDAASIALGCALGAYVWFHGAWRHFAA